MAQSRVRILHEPNIIFPLIKLWFIYTLALQNLCSWNSRILSTFYYKISGVCNRMSDSASIEHSIWNNIRQTNQFKKKDNPRTKHLLVWVRLWTNLIKRKTKKWTFLIYALKKINSIRIRLEPASLQSLSGCHIHWAISMLWIPTIFLVIFLNRTYTI